jgi:hypothetical protein
LLKIRTSTYRLRRSRRQRRKKDLTGAVKISIVPAASSAAPRSRDFVPWRFRRLLSVLVAAGVMQASEKHNPRRRGGVAVRPNLRLGAFH